MFPIVSLKEQPIESKRIALFISQDLLDELNKHFPNRCARKGMTDQDIWIEAGHREVIDFLTSALSDLDSESIQSL